MLKNPYTLNYFEVLNILDLNDDEFDYYLIEFTLKFFRNKEYDEEEDLPYLILKDLEEENRDLLLDYIQKHRTDAFDEEFKDYLIEENYNEFEKQIY